MRSENSRRMGMKANGQLNDAFFLGLASIGTQVVFLRLILSSQAGGELYVALALGGWLGWVGVGSLIGRKSRFAQTPALWIITALIKIPLAFLIAIYPSLFFGLMDPLRFLPLAIIGMAPLGIFYGLLFPALIKGQDRPSVIYRNEAAGSAIGGVLVTVWASAGWGNFALLVLLALIELSRSVKRLTYSISLAAIGLILGFLSDPIITGMVNRIRWPGFETISSSQGYSGSWNTLKRGKQTTIFHNGLQVGNIPDRIASEEALIWPLLFLPDSRRMLLIGFEGVEISSFIPGEIEAVLLIQDKAYLRLGMRETAKIELADPVSYNPEIKYDIVNIRLPGSGNLSDYRLETEYFLKRAKSFVEPDGILFLSAPSDENYISPEISLSLASLLKTLANIFGDSAIKIIPGPRAGFVCLNSGGNWPDSTFESLNLASFNSPFFNRALIVNTLSPFRVNKLIQALRTDAKPNNILKPQTVLQHLIRQGSQYGRQGGSLFDLYRAPYPLIVIPVMLFLPILSSISFKRRLRPLNGAFILGFLGMAFEILILYLFQILFGSLYLHIGLLMAVFMAGLAIGSGLSVSVRWRLNFLALILTCCMAFGSAYLAGAGISLPLSGLFLYIVSVLIGIATGAGLANLIDSGNGHKDGALYYALDLSGALSAAVFIPGLIIWIGTIPLLSALTLLSVLGGLSIRVKK